MNTPSRAMSPRRTRIIFFAGWSASSCVAALWVSCIHARYITDLSAFLPANPTHPCRSCMVDQLREGPAVATDPDRARGRPARGAGTTRVHGHGAPPAPRWPILASIGNGETD